MPNKRPLKATVVKERTVHTYAELWHASGCVLKAGQAQPVGSSWQFLSSIVLSAFAFEAYLNHAGQNNFASWDGLERLSTPDKFAFLCEMFKAQFSTKKGERPLNTIKMLLDFRNTLAHGKTEVLKPPPKEQDVDEYLDASLGERPLAEWERQIQNSNFAQLVRADVETVLTELHRVRPEPKEALFSFGLGLHSASIDPVST